MTDPYSSEEQRLCRLLMETKHAGEPVDEVFLARLREATTQIVKCETESVAALPVRLHRLDTYRSRPMVRFGFSLAAAAMLVFGLALVSWWKPAAAGTLSEGFAQLEKLDSFVATIQNAGGTGNVRYASPAMLRVDQGTRYILYRDGQSWDVSEAENRAVRRREVLFPGGRLNIARLLHLPGDVDLTEEPVQVSMPQRGMEERLYHLGRSTLELRWLINLATGQTVKFLVRDLGVQPVREEEFTLVKTNVPLAAEMFQLKDTLTEDGRIGIVQDIQGVVMVQPVGRERWTPLAVGDVIKPGDLVRANPRGPNAARLRMAPNTDLTFGPGATVELKSPTEYRLMAGEMEVHPRERKVTVISPAANGLEKTVVEDKTVLQANAEKVIALKEQPAWLKGFQGTVANESLGQLLAKVDDRNVPLNVGYHKVDVDVRDGLARTTVEESFINTTNRELEGTFFFPLPSDASIAGFGMWIGNELVEADIVEKQRAREIFDIILSEKKDPALLEWAGGNLFKTRVFPIPAHGEKRIKITYTQALPLEGNRFRYSYALLSDLLKQHPLKELSVTLTVSSAWPLAKVYSPTHPAREEKAGSAARLVFTAQEYVPTRDFEAVIEMASTPAPVTLLPHRRGEDGYFLLRLAPPQSNAGWEREVVRDGPPLHLLILCDTSASIDKQQRTQQQTFVDALLGSLTARDTFNLACFDVETDWAFHQQQNVEAKSITQAQALLAGRRSMGWTDFEKAFASAEKQAAFQSGTVIVYLGDGVPAMSWGHDPKVLVDRLKGMVSRQKAPVHAVALGSLHEPLTLRAMAGLSGGSWRKIAADRGPALQARDLLQELTDPNLLRDLKVSFTGLQTAKVYPETLPNVQQGTGLVLAGRYLPSSKAQSGKVNVSGLRGSTPVSYQAEVTLPEGDAGNSFIPRLWARQHIESLLESGGSAARDEIIARSEEFHLMTPYTSMLVLENDAMRERFAVKKRFNMRDGERFFADGRTQSELMLRQKQMSLAANWRLELRKQTLAQLATLGRGQQPQRYPRRGQIPAVTGSTLRGFNGQANNSYLGAVAYDLGEVQSEAEGKSMFGFSAGLGGAMGGEGFDGPVRVVPSSGAKDQLYYYDPALGTTIDSMNRLKQKREISDLLDGAIADNKNLEMDYRFADGGKVLGKAMRDAERAPWLEPPQEPILEEHYTRRALPSPYSKTRGMWGNTTIALDYSESMELDGIMRESMGRVQNYQSYAVLGLQQLFPSLGAAPLIAEPAASKPPMWSPEIVEIVKSLDQREKLKKVQGTLQLDRVVQSYDFRRGALVRIDKRTEHVSPSRWHTVQMNDQGSTLIEWCTQVECAALNLAYMTGRQRVSSQPERERLPIEWDDKSLEDLTQTFGQIPATLERLPGDQVCITVTYADQRGVKWTIDTRRQVMLAIEHFDENKVNARIVFEDFQQVAGRWWAGKRTVYDSRGRIESVSVQKVQLLGEERFAQTLAESKKQQALCFMLTSPLPSLAAAKKATAPGGPGGAVEHLVMMSHFASSQQWVRVKEHLAQLEKLPQKYAAVPWIRLLVLNAAREHAALQNEVWKHAQALLKQPRVDLNDDWNLFIFLQNQLSGITTPQEALRFMKAHRGIYARQPAHLRAPREYQKLQAQHLAGANRREEALAIWKQLAESDLHDSTVHWSYFNALLQCNDVEAAQQFLFKLMEPDREIFSDPSQSQSYWQQIFYKLYELGRYADAYSFASQWVKREPTQLEAHHAYLLSLVLTEQEEEFQNLQMMWIMAGPGAKSGTVQDRQFDAALAMALGHSRFGFEHQWHIQGREKLHAPLIAFVDAYITDPRQMNNVNMVLGSPAGTSAAGIALREKLPVRASEECATLAVEKLNALIQNAAYAYARNDAIAKEQKKHWEQIAGTLKGRWKGLADGKDRFAMGDVVSMVLQRHGTSAEYLAFLRERIQNELAEYRLGLLNQLYSYLFQQELTDAIEKELFALLAQLDEPRLPTSHLLAARSQRVLALSDRILQVRLSRLQNAIPEKEKLDRVKLQEMQAAATKQAHREMVERLKQLETGVENLRPWIEVEALYHRIKSEDDLSAVSEAAWKAYESIPKIAGSMNLADIKTEKELNQWRLDMFNESLRVRHLTMLTYLAARTMPKQPAVADRLKTFVQARLQAEPASDYWRLAWQRLLIALDQPRELEASLREWLVTTGTDQRYRLLLAYLQAERGGLQEAVDLLEKVEVEDELAPSDWRALSNWLLVLNQQAAHQRAKAQQYATASEQALYGYLQLQQNRVTIPGQAIPQKLDEDTFLVIPELFKRSASPSNYFYLIQQLYEATKDFRLLAGLAEGMVGHTPGQVYPMLQAWRGLVQTIQEEATLDELDKKIAELRKTTASNVDLRAFDLLEAMLHRKAATQINQPGEHAKKAIDCLQRAMKHQWQREEPPALARLFYVLHQENHPAWKEQLQAAFQQLFDLTEPGSPERVEVVLHYAAYHPNPIPFLQKAIEEVRSKSSGGLLPDYCQSIVGDYLGRSVGHELTMEAFALQELKRPGYSPASQEWFKNQLHDIYVRAYQSGGRVSLGAGTQLYKALESLFEKELRGAASQERRHHYLSRLNNHYRQAASHREPTVQADCKGMLTERIIPLLKGLTYQRKEIVGTLATTVFDIVGKADGMRFLLDEYDRAPFSARYQRYDAWEAYQGYLAGWRGQVSDAGLIDRYLNIVTQRLTSYLVHGTQQNEVFFKGHQYYWAEKEEVFAATALAVFAAREPTPALADRVANYLRSGIIQPGKAADFLKSIRQSKAYTEDLQYLLAVCLIEINQHQEAVVELKQLYAAKPRMRYGLRLMGCYHTLNQRDALQQMLAALEKEFSPKGIWTVNNLERVAQTCYETRLFVDAERLYQILIPQYRQEQKDKNLDQGKLWSYYRYQALTLMELDKTGPALESIRSAIVLWGSTFQQRADVLDSLRTVMRVAKDPHSVIRFLDDEARKNQGRENVLLRRMLAEVLIEKNQHGLAVTQLKAVLELKPDDDPAHRLLIQAYDALGQPQEALKAALTRSEFVGRQTATWKELGERFSKQKEEVQAERAFTSMIEVLPNDADAEMALAQVRESQNRWQEAIDLWKLARDYRAEDPSGLLGLAKAYVHEKRWPEAKATLELLRKPAKPWHQRFDGLKVKEQVEVMGKGIP